MVHSWSTNAPLEPHCASWPSIQAAWVPVQADLGFRDLKRSLNCCAWARLLAKTWAGTVEVPVGKLVKAVGTPASGVPVGRTVTVAVDVVVMAVVVVAGGGGGGNADDDGGAATLDATGLVVEVEEETEGVGRNTGFVKMVGCVLSGVVTGTVTAWLVMLVSEGDELEVGKAVEDVDVGGTVTSAGAVEVKNSASLVAVVAGDGVDVELEAASWVDTTFVVEAKLVGNPAEDVVSKVMRVVPGFVVLEVRLLPPVNVGMALVVG